MEQFSLRPKRRGASKTDALQSLIHPMPLPIHVKILESPADVLDLHAAPRVRVPLGRQGRLVHASLALVGRQGSTVLVFGWAAQFVEEHFWQFQCRVLKWFRGNLNQNSNQDAGTGQKTQYITRSEDIIVIIIIRFHTFNIMANM